MNYRYYEYDDTYFRGRADAAGVDDVWNPTTQKWVPYKGPDSTKRSLYGNNATKEEAESQHWENGRLVCSR